MARRAVDRQVIKRFVALTEDRQREIKAGGEGIYCLLLPGSLAQYPKNRYPQLYENGRPPTIKCNGKRYIVLTNLRLGTLAKLAKLPGSIEIPRRYKETPIEEILS